MLSPVFSGVCGHAQVMQAAGGQHDLVHQARTPVTEGVGHDAAPLHPADRVLHAHPRLADDLVDELLNRVKFVPVRLLLGLECGAATRRRVALEARVLEHQRVGGKLSPLSSTSFLSRMLPALIGPR